MNAKYKVAPFSFMAYEIAAALFLWTVVMGRVNQLASQCPI